MSDTYEQRKDRPVLGKKRFDVTHYEPKLSELERKERMQRIGHELYAVFRAHAQNSTEGENEMDKETMLELGKTVAALDQAEDTGRVIELSSLLASQVREAVENEAELGGWFTEYEQAVSQAEFSENVPQTLSEANREMSASKEKLCEASGQIPRKAQENII